MPARASEKRRHFCGLRYAIVFTEPGVWLSVGVLTHALKINPDRLLGHSEGEADSKQRAGPLWVGFAMKTVRLGSAPMSKALKLLNQVRKDEEGAALIEYTILLGVIAVAVIGFATTISGWISSQWGALCGKLTGAAC